MSARETLRKVSDIAYEEADPPKDRSRPLQWRRSVNTIRMNLVNVRVRRDFVVNEVDSWPTSDDEKVKPGAKRPEVRAKGTTSVAIEADVDQEVLADRILFGVETGRGSGQVLLESAGGGFRFQLQASEPRTPGDERYKDVYAGHFGRDDFRPGDDGKWLDLTAPQSVVDQLATAVARDSRATLEASIGLESFTFEVDDVLNEWYHPREMFVVNGHGRAFLEEISVSTSSTDATARRQNHEDEPDNSYEDEAPAQPVPEATIIKNAGAIAKALKSVKVAIYVAGIAIALAVLVISA